MRYSTTVKPRLSIPSNSHVRIGIFNGGMRFWQRKAVAWLIQMRSRGLGCSGFHTLQVEDSRRVEVFHLLVCQPMPNSPPIPAKITDCLEAGSQLGNVVFADVGTSPPTVRVLEDFWAGPSPEHEPNFERLVRPLMDKLVSSFGKGELWAS